MFKLILYIRHYLKTLKININILNIINSRNVSFIILSYFRLTIIKTSMSTLRKISTAIYYFLTKLAFLRNCS